MARRRVTRRRLTKAGREGMRMKREAGMLPPRVCANPKCEADLSDPGVPEEYAEFAELFGLAIEIMTATPGVAIWRCPVCDHTWGKHKKIEPTEGLL